MRLLGISLFVFWIFCVVVTISNCSKAVDEAGGVEEIIVYVGKEVKHIKERINDEN